MFCVECGIEGSTFEGLCAKCYVKQNKFFKFPKEIIITRCKECPAFRINHKWQQGNVSHIIETFVLQKIKAEIPHQCIFDYEMQKVICKGEFEGIPIHEEQHIAIKEKEKLCPQCSLRKGGYFEAILQIRGAIEKNSTLIEKTIMHHLTAHQSFITKKEEVRGGIDYYFGNKHIADKVAKELKEKLGGTISISSSLVGMKKGEQIYRDTYCVRIPTYLGSFIKLNDTLYQIIGKGKKLYLKDMKGETHHIYEEELKKAVHLDIEPREATVLHHDNTTLYVLDSIDYRTKAVSKPVTWTGKKTIHIIEYSGALYAVE